MLGVGKRTKLCREAWYVRTFKAVEAVCKGWVRPKNRPTGSYTSITVDFWFSSFTSSHMDGNSHVIKSSLIITFLAHISLMRHMCTYVSLVILNIPKVLGHFIIPLNFYLKIRPKYSIATNSSVAEYADIWILDNVGPNTGHLHTRNIWILEKSEYWTLLVQNSYGSCYFPLIVEWNEGVIG